MRYESRPSSHLPKENQETTKERALRQKLKRQEELTYTASDYQRWGKNRNRVIAERKKENSDAEDAKSIVSPPTIDPNNMYWPTHDFIKGEDVNVVLRRELESNHQQALLLTLDDAAKTLASMWDDNNRTDTLKLLDKIRGPEAQINISRIHLILGYRQHALLP